MAFAPGLSAYFAIGVFQAKMAGSATMAIIGGSGIRSGGMYALSGGDRDFTVSFGAFSYNFSQNDLGYLGEEGNSGWQNAGYALGLTGNFRDVVQTFGTEEYTFYMKKRLSMHVGWKNADGDIALSQGPASDFKDHYPGNLFGSNNYENGLPGTGSYFSPDSPTASWDLSGIRLNPAIMEGTKQVADNMNYALLTTNCVNISSAMLWANGVANIGLYGPFNYGSVYLYQQGVDPVYMGTYLQ